MFAAQAIEGGARGYVSKSDDPEDVHDRYPRGARAAATALAPRIWRRKSPSCGGASEGFDVAVAREREVLRLLAKGKSMSEIAALINVSYKTVATTCATLRAKFSARTPMQLIRIAVEQKIV